MTLLSLFLFNAKGKQLYLDICKSVTRRYAADEGGAYSEKKISSRKITSSHDHQVKFDNSNAFLPSNNLSASLHEDDDIIIAQQVG
jgi:hypothetical protein